MTTHDNLETLRENLERRLGLFRALTQELIESHPAFMKMELDEIYRHIGKQTDICELLRRTDETAAAAWKAVRPEEGSAPHDEELSTWVNGLDVRSADQFRRLLTDIALAEGELRHQNRIHITLVDGSRRTLNVLGNALAAFSPTYALPSSLKSVVSEKKAS